MALCDNIQQLGKGISNAARYQMVTALIDGPKTVTELVTIVHISQPAVSQHLATLKECNLVKSKKSGQEVVYSLNTAHMLSILKALSSDVSKCKEKNK